MKFGFNMKRSLQDTVGIIIFLVLPTGSCHIDECV